MHSWKQMFAYTHKCFVSVTLCLIGFIVHVLYVMVFFSCICVGGCVRQWAAWVGNCAHETQKRLWIINTPLAADERVPARSALTFREPVSLRFKHARLSSHLIRGERTVRGVTFPWHWHHAGSHLIYTASEGTEASLTSLIFPMPCRHTLTHTLTFSDARLAASSFAPHLLHILIKIFPSVGWLPVH